MSSEKGVEIGLHDTVTRVREDVVHEDAQFAGEGDNFSEPNTSCASHLDDDADHDPRLSSATVPPTESPLFEPMDDDDTNMDEIPALSEPSSPILSPTLPMLDGLKRARAIKAEISTSLSILQPKKPAARRRVEDDPENQLIKTLRQDHHMGWDAIATYLNEERLKRGEPGNLTTPAVYSRFVRNGPRIAAALGEVGFDPKDYMHLRNPAQNFGSSSHTGGNLGIGIGAGRKRVRREGNEEQELRNNVRKRSALAEQARELEKEDMTEMLVSAVAMVERNFWTFVADELERSCARLFEPRACESRFHAI